MHTVHAQDSMSICVSVLDAVAMIHFFFPSTISLLIDCGDLSLPHLYTVVPGHIPVVVSR